MDEQKLILGALVGAGLLLLWQHLRARPLAQIITPTPESKSAYELTKGYFTDWA
jgi:hypothetical protein